MKKGSHKKKIADLWIRRLQWLGVRSGVIPLACEHFLAMIPATILVPVLVNNSFNTTIIDVSLVLLTSGIGTLLFLLLSKGKIPAYFGSSFAYIGVTVHIIETNLDNGMSYVTAFSYVSFMYIFSALLLFLLSFLYRIHGIKRVFSWVFPATVIGPAISLIGLEFADTAVTDSGFDIEKGLVDEKSALIAMVTLFSIIFFSMAKKNSVRNAAIIFGVIVGCVWTYVIGGFREEIENEINLFEFSIPSLFSPFRTSFPSLSTLLSLSLAAVPPTLIVFSENIGRVTIIDKMMNLNNKNDDSFFSEDTVKTLGMTLRSHALSSVVVTMLGSVPNTMYAENIAVMNIHRPQIKRKDPDRFINGLVAPWSIVPYCIAAVLAIVFSFSTALQTLLLAIPKPVIGGMELFLFGIISSPGIQMLVEQQVDYKKTSNQIVTAAVLISGISGLSINFIGVELKGMSLGLIVGVVLNFTISILKRFGIINDDKSFDELIFECVSILPKSDSCYISYIKKQPDGEISTNKIAINVLNVDLKTDFVNLNLVEVESKGDVFLRFKIMENSYLIEIRSDRIMPGVKTAYINDHESIDEHNGWVLINSPDHIPVHKIKKLISKIEIGDECT